MVKENDPRDGMLTPQQKRAIPHLLSSPSIREGCKKASISHTTFYRWLSDPVFKKELDRLNDEASRQTVNILRRHAAQAARHLVGLMKARDPVLKRRVCNDVLNLCLRYEENKDLESRVRQPEQIAEAKKL
jgi:hypothetical protein